MTEHDLTAEEIAAGWQQTEWTYLGRRMTSRGKVTHHFLDAGGERRSFDKIMTAPVLGGVYLVEWINKGDGIRARVQGARYLRRTDSPKLDEWRLADRATSAQLEAVRSRKRAAGENGDFGELTLADVRRMVTMTSTSAQRAGTIAAVLHYIARG